MSGTAGLGLCSACALKEALPAKTTPTAGEADDSASRPKASGDYELLDEIARGGMGVVYRARQRSLNRVVALKVLLGGAFAGAEGRRRLKAEAAAAARLKHPNIVAVHDSGELDGQPFYSMDFIEGRTLAEVFRDGPLPARRAASYLARIASAVQHAHDQGVLHRDLKPSNVLVDARDEPQVTDFGLARMMDGDASGTLTGAVLGSPAYMPPEQALGRNREVSAVSDVYALGAVLYEMVTGRPPFFAESPQAVIEQVKTREPVAPRQLNASVPVDLETICLKCLAKDPARRYASAQALGEDVERFLQGEPVRARPVSAPGRFARWCRRHPALAAAWFLVVLLAVGSLTAAIWIADARDAAVAANAHSRQSLYAARLAEARALVTTRQPGQRVQALAALREAAGIRPSPELRDVAIKALTRVDVTPTREFAARPAQGRVWRPHPSLKSHVVEAQPGILEWRDLATDRELGRLDNSRLGKLAQVPHFDAAGRHVAVTSTNGTVAIWSLDPVKQLWVAPGGASLQEDRFRQPVDFSSDGERVAVAGLKGGLSIHQLTDGRELNHIDLPIVLDQVHFSSDSRGVAVASHHSNVVHVLPAGAGSARWSASLPANIAGLAWRPDGRELAAGLVSGSIQVLNAADGALRRELQGHTATATVLCYSSDGQILWSRGLDSTMRAWLTATGEEQLMRLDSMPDPDLTFSADGREAVFSHEWTQAVAAQVDRPSAVARFASLGPPAPAVLVGALSFSADSRWLAFATFSGVTLVNVPERKRAAWIPAEWSPGRRGIEPTARFSADARALFFCQRPTGLIRVPLHPQPDGTLALGSSVAVDAEAGFTISDLSADGRWLLLTQRRPGTLKILDAVTGELVKRLDGQAELLDARISPDRRWVITQITGLGRPPNTHPRLWSTATWTVAREIEVGPLGLLSFSADGRYLAAGGQLGFQLWSDRDFSRRMALPEAIARADGVVPALAHDGRLLAAAGNASVQLIDPGSGRLLATLPPLGDNGQAARPSLSPDGRTLAVLCDDGTLDLWDLAQLRAELAGLGLDW